MSESSPSENAPENVPDNAPEKAPTPASEPAPETPDVTALTKRLEDAQSKLDTLRRGVKRSSIISTSIGVVLLLLLTGYFTYGYVWFLGFVNEPQQMVSLVGQTVQGYLPEARQQLEDVITEDAPEWAEMASEELITNAPKIRGKLEELILDQTEKVVETISGFTAKQFKTFLKEQRPWFEASIQELSSSHKPPDKTMAELTDALEHNLQVNMKDDADSLLETLYTLNEKLQTLSDGHELTLEESYLRRSMMILRLVHLEQTDPDLVGKKRTLESKPDPTLVEETPEKPDEKPEPDPEEKAPEAKEDPEPKDDAPPAEAKEEAKPKAEAPAPDAKEETKPKAGADEPESESE